MERFNLREIRFGPDRIADRQDRPRHCHRNAYATVVLAGVFEQTSYTGRHRVAAGDVLIQPTMDCHADRMLSAGIELLRLPWRFDPGNGGIYRGCDIDEISRLARTSCDEAAMNLGTQIELMAPSAPLSDNWADLFVQTLLTNPQLRIQELADRHGHSREWACRSVQSVYGVSPVQLRSEVRARAAWRGSIACEDALASVALDLGYADQPHMTRCVRWLTGATPAEWRRRSQICKTSILT